MMTRIHEFSFTIPRPCLCHTLELGGVVRIPTFGAPDDGAETPSKVFGEGVDRRG